MSEDNILCQYCGLPSASYHTYELCRYHRFQLVLNGDIDVDLTNTMPSILPPTVDEIFYVFRKKWFEDKHTEHELYNEELKLNWPIKDYLQYHKLLMFEQKI